jgi:hypothetical protein
MATCIDHVVGHELRDFSGGWSTLTHIITDHAIRGTGALPGGLTYRGCPTEPKTGDLPVGRTYHGRPMEPKGCMSHAVWICSIFV